jgi:hypothetical protein
VFRKEGGRKKVSLKKLHIRTQEGFRRIGQVGTVMGRGKYTASSYAILCINSFGAMKLGAKRHPIDYF